MRLSLLLIVAVSALVEAQYDGPVPPRPVIPGAIPVGRSTQVIRRRPAQQAQSAVVAETPVRRGGSRGGPRRLPPPLEQSLSARPPPRQLYQDTPIPVVRAPVAPVSVTPRPVFEEPEDEDDSGAQTNPTVPPQLPSPAPSQPPQPSQSFRGIDDFVQPTRQQYRPQPVHEEEPQHVRRTQSSVNRQENRQEGRQQKPYVQQQYNRHQQVARPAQKEVVHEKPSTERQRKPQIQTIRKYREDNPDGSITWGFENDDGTFKEETIGTDCVTRGKYGYVDPDGVRREYTYNSGIPCDRKEDSETQATNEGYIDYTNNKYVFPNGESIDLDNMVRNRARKPVYRN